jgi:hypothetical protein
MHHSNKNTGAPNDKPNNKGRSNEADGPIFHLRIQTAEKIVPAIDKSMIPAVLSITPSIRLSLALICSYRKAQISS